MTNRRVVVTGLGVVSCVGTGVPDFWRAVCEGRSGIRPLTRFDTSDFRFTYGGEAQGFQADAGGPDLATQFMLTAAEEAVGGLEVGELNPSRAGVALATNFGAADACEKFLAQTVSVKSVEPGVFQALGMENDTDAVRRALSAVGGFEGPCTLLSLACASGNSAIGYALDAIRLGRADVMLAGGYDAISRYVWSLLSAFGIIVSDKEKPNLVRPFDKNRKGTIFSEGAGALLLEELGHAQQRGARIYAEVLGHAMNNNAHHMTHADPGGRGTALVMRMAAQDAGVSPDEIDHINSHATGTPVGDPLEVAAIKSFLGPRASRVPVNAIKSTIGHLMGAAGAAEAVASVMSIVDGIIPPTANYETPDPACDLDCVPNVARQQRVNVVLSNSAGIGGANSAVIFRRFG